MILRQLLLETEPLAVAAQQDLQLIQTLKLCSHYTGWLWRWHEKFSLWANRTPGLLNFVFQTIVRFLAEKWRHKIDSKILFQLMAQQIGNFEAGIETNAKIWKTQLLKEI